MKQKSFLLILACSLVMGVQAKVRPASLFQDGMVLQQKSDARIWGWAKPNSKVTVTNTWNKQKSVVQSDASGRWQTTIATPAATFEPQEVTISDGEKLTLKDVLIGEVWLGSGQSNMEMPLLGYGNCPIENFNQVIRNAQKYTGRVHYATLKRAAVNTPADTASLKWQDIDSETALHCSATCYFFGTALSDVLNVPVGLIVTSWGGTSAESWSPADVLPAPQNDNEKKDFAVRYNGMIHPLEGYTIKGFLWYQGEANVYRADKYAALLGNMIKSWRQRWGQGDLPFYLVEIAPWQYNGKEKMNAAYLREAQLDVTHQVPNTGIVGTNNLVKTYEYNQIHPCMKREVGENLCNLALAKTYKMKGLIAQNPEYQGMEVKGNKVLVKFNNTPFGFNRFDGMVGFEVCGSNGVFYPANGKAINNETVEVSSSNVPEPKSVRYCFKNWQLGNATNLAGLSIMPFRSDR